MAFIGASRSNLVGTDTSMYETLFSQYIGVSSVSGKFPVYNTYSAIIYYFSSSPHTITAVNSIVICVLFAIFLMRIRVQELYAIFLFSALFFFGNSLNSSRQYIAMGLVVNAAVYFYHKKTLPAVLLFILATGIHSTAVMALFFIPIYFMKWNKKTMLCFILVLSLLIPLQSIIIQEFVKLFPDYNIYMGQNALGVSTTGAGASILFNLFIFIVYFGAIILILYKKVILSKFETGIFYIYATYAYLDLIFSNMVIVQRVFMYFSIFGIIVFPILFQKLSQIVEKRTMVIINIIFIAFMIYYYYIQLSHDYIGIVPYLF
ncbi:MAG: EpsG family protein [Streptococcaceae bacterium]|nr:EpsG family protein [Streptococcaceae bacterium]